jgi:ABC-type cobalamin/Fe3+-siderophores transport system ATPase subunit
LNEKKRTQQERERSRFRHNLAAVFELKTLELGNAVIFSNLSWDLTPKINVLLGRNGYGKSLLLRLMTGMLSYDDDQLAVLLSDSGEDRRLTVRLLRDGRPADIVWNDKALSSEVGKIPILAIPDSRFINRARDGFSAEGDDNFDPARDGARHFLHELPYEARLQTILAQMCIEYVNARGKNGSPSGPSTPQLDLVAGVIRELSGERFQFRSIEPIGNARFSIEVETDASPGKPVPLQRASQGTLSVVAIFALIYQFLKAAHASVSGAALCQQPAIVIIDEVDAHLHPEWQRKIIEMLRKRFPNVQFILTAHSPLVVAGCRSGEVALLRRENTSFQLVDLQRDFVGTAPEEIYRQVFEIEDRDVRFLELQARIPELPELIGSLERAKQNNGSATEISALEATIAAIRRAEKQQSDKVGLERLVLENEQLRRELEAAQRKTDQPSKT